MSCNSTYRLRYWNLADALDLTIDKQHGCNSTYRLRYWNNTNAEAIFTNPIVATVPTVYGIETHYI